MERLFSGDEISGLAVVEGRGVVIADAAFSVEPDGPPVGRVWYRDLEAPVERALFTGTPEDPLGSGLAVFSPDGEAQWLLVQRVPPEPARGGVLGEHGTLAVLAVPAGVGVTVGAAVVGVDEG